MSADQILVVDDSESSRDLLSAILTAEGHYVRIASSGELALAAVAASPPDLILLDLRLPGIDGIEVCRELKERTESRDIPIIFLSAEMDLEDRLKGLDAGAVDFVTKPFRSKELLARIRTQLELSRLHRDLEHRVTERTRELRAANDKLKHSYALALAHQKDESVSTLAAGIAHTFNNMLSSILGHAELALGEVSSEALAHECLSSIMDVSLKASEVVSLLMAYAGQAASDPPELVELTSVVEQTVRLASISIPETTKLETNLSKDTPVLWTNAGQIRQLLLNLILNASEALQGKPGTVKISTGKFLVDASSSTQQSPDLPPGNYATLEISDTGCGMTKEIQTRIFEPFFTTKSFGRGLGLPSVQGFVHGMGGLISVMSTPGVGSTFKIWLPSSDV
jgi:signal transduction histidine kinase